MLTPRRGAGLAELLVAVAAFGLVATAIHRVLTLHQRAHRVQAQRIDLLQNLRAAATILPAELRELDARDGDVLALGPHSLTIRAPRQLALVCGVPAIAPAAAGAVAATITIRRDPFFGVRDLEPERDSIFLFYEGDAATPADDGWVRGRLVAEPLPARCPDGAAGRRLALQLRFGAGQVAATGAIPSGAPLRGYEPVTYTAYRAADGAWYLGAQTPGAARQPLAGPLTGLGGLAFAYRDSAGAPTTVPARVAQIAVMLRARSRSLIDSLTIVVALRNTRQ